MKGVTKGEEEKVEKERNNSDNSVGFISHATVAAAAAADLNDAQHWKIKTAAEGGRENGGHRCQMLSLPYQFEEEEDMSLTVVQGWDPVLKNRIFGFLV